MEDRLLQKAVARILNAIYEADFLPCSFGFRPERSPHQALAAVRNPVMAGRAAYVFETDVRGFFDQLNHQWLTRMLKLRVADPVILSLVGKWLRAGVVEGGVLVGRDKGSPQGGPVSPILANIYLHYALDLWFEKRFRKRCQGKVYLTRFADDFVAAFQYRGEAIGFERAVRARLAKFGLELAEEKTRLIPFGRYAVPEAGEKPGSFEFLGFKHVIGKDRNGRFAVVRIPSVKSCRKFLERVTIWLKRNRHNGRPFQQKRLTLMLRGFYQYFGLHGCSSKLRLVRYRVVLAWVKALRQLSQRHRFTWARLNRKSWFELPYPRTLHPNV